MTEIAGYIFLAFAGWILGAMGVGGSSLTVPILVFLFSLEAEIASAYSMFVVGVTSLAGIAARVKTFASWIRPGLWIGIPAAFGSFVSRKILLVQIPVAIEVWQGCTASRHQFLLLLFAVLIIVSSLPVLLNKAPRRDGTSTRPLVLVTIGVIAGTVAGLAGVGGGFVIVPALIAFAGVSSMRTSAASLFVIAASTLTGFCGDVSSREIEWFFLLRITAPAVFGVMLGTWSAKHVISGNSWRMAFAWLSLAVGLFIVYEVM